MVTELELVDAISAVDSELEDIRKKIKYIELEWEKAHTILGKLNLDKKNLKEELRVFRDMFPVKEISEREIEISEFRTRVDKVLKEV
jgi:predicted  nucleic acid-binding Zn-ribbon protein